MVTLLQDILNQINPGEVSPRKKDVVQPSEDEIKKSIGWLSNTLLELEKQRSVQARVHCHTKIDPYRFPLEYFDLG